MLQRGFSRFGGANGEIVEVAPVTLPGLSCLKEPLVDDGAEAERREIAQKFATARTIKAGLDAWNNLSRCCTPAAHRTIGAALAKGREHILHVTGQTDTCGGRYTKEFGRWFHDRGFSGMSKSQRAWTLALYDAGDPLLQWWHALPVSKQRRLLQAQSICRAWLGLHTEDQMRRRSGEGRYRRVEQVYGSG